MNCVGESWCADEMLDCAWGHIFFFLNKRTRNISLIIPQRLKEIVREGRYGIFCRIFQQSQGAARVLLYSVEDELKTLQIAPQRIVRTQDLSVHKSSRAVCSAKNRFISTAFELQDERARRLTGKKEGADKIANSEWRRMWKNSRKNSAGVSRLGLNWWLGIWPSKFTHLEVLCSHNLESRAEHVSNADFQPCVFSQPQPICLLTWRHTISGSLSSKLEFGISD